MRRKDILQTFQTYRRWRSSRLQRVSEWQFTSAYWKLRQRLLNTNVRLGSHLFLIKEYYRTRRESVMAFRILLSGILKPVVLTVVIVCLLELVEHLTLLYGSFLWRFIPDKTHSWFFGADKIFKRNADTYVTFFATFAQIAGAFLALYFTAVSVVVSTVYARVQGDVRSVVLRDKVSNVYVKLVAMLGASSTVLLSLLALGYLPSVSNLIFAALVGLASIYSFVELGSRIFYFFDPTKLAGYLTSDVVRWVQGATSRGYRWQNESFQAHYQKQADAVLTTYRNIVLLANREEHLQSDALAGLAQRALSLLSIYGKEKPSIPSDSLWFRRTHRHKFWLTTPTTEIITALNTGTSLQPEIVPDLMWFESEIEKTITYTLSELLSRKDLQRVYAFSDTAQRTLYNLASNFAVDEALHLFRTIAPLLREQSHTTELTGTPTEDDLLKLNVALGLTELYALGFIQILLGLSNRLSELTVDSLSKKVTDVNWKRSGTIYETSLPRIVIEQMEVLRKHLDFERCVEGELITPLWYRQQVVAIAFIRFFEQTCNNLLAEFEEAIANEAESLIREKKAIFAAQLIERGLEGCDKFSYHFDAFQKYVDALYKLRKIEDRPCPAINWESNARRIVKVRERLVASLAQSTLALASLPKTDKIPDYFGHAYAYISDECYRTLAEGEKARFSELFPIFFRSGLTARDQLTSAPVAAAPLINFGFSVQPLIDVIDISGFAYLFTELDGNDFRDAVDKVWDSYLDAAPDKEAAANFICLNVTHKESLFRFFPRDNIREGWVQDFERRLRHLGLLEMPLYNFVYEDKVSSRHPSKLISKISVGIMLDYKPSHVFLAEYFMKRFDPAKLDLPGKAKELFRAMNQNGSAANTGERNDKE